MQLEGATQTFVGGSWTNVVFSTPPALASTGWSVAATGAITFPQAGVYQVTLTYRGCPDQWTAVRLFDVNTGTETGHSAGHGGGAANPATTVFLAQVQGVLSGYSIQLGYAAGSGNCTLLTPAAIPGPPSTTPPAIQATVVKIG
jgi:hypothetical protein